jgi:hypothetical protein
LLRQLAGARRVAGEEQFDHRHGGIHAAGGIQARRNLERHLSGCRHSVAGKARHVQQRAQAGVADGAQTAQPVFDQDAVLAGERHHVGHRGDGHQLEERFATRRTFSGGHPSVASSACASLNATPAPHRFFSGYGQSGRLGLSTASAGGSSVSGR